MTEPAIFIEVRFSNGKMLRAEGDHAKTIWEWLVSCEVIAAVHGIEYEGEPMQEVQKSEVES